MEENGAEKLMNTLISKMESIDSEVQILKAENAALRRVVDSPAALLRKAGYVSVRTPLADDVSTDPLRGDLGVDSQAIVKSDNTDSYSNEDIHKMSWSEIHEMAEQTREVKEMY
jgi:hypothetical protein